MPTKKTAKKTAKKPTLVAVRATDGNGVWSFAVRKDALAFAKRCLAEGCEVLVSTGT